MAKATTIGSLTGLALAAAATFAPSTAEARFHCMQGRVDIGTVTDSKGNTGKDFDGALAAGEPGTVHCRGRNIKVNGNNNVPYVGLSGGASAPKAPTAVPGKCIVVRGTKYCQ